MKGKWKTRKGIYKYESKKADDNDRAGDSWCLDRYCWWHRLAAFWRVLFLYEWKAGDNGIAGGNDVLTGIADEATQLRFDEFYFPTKGTEGGKNRLELSKSQ